MVALPLNNVLLPPNFFVSSQFQLPSSFLAQHLQVSQLAQSASVPQPVLSKESMDHLLSSIARVPISSPPQAPAAPRLAQTPLSIAPASVSPSEQSSGSGRQMTVPSCAICEAKSTGIHFGSEACAACSAFFRRTIVLDKKYSCSKHNNCVVLKDAPEKQKCRACRFAKCLRAGMDRNAVQHRRDAIGKYSAEAAQARENELKRTFIEDMDDDDCGTLDSVPLNNPVYSPQSPVTPTIQTSVLDEFVFRHEYLNRRRKMFYGSSKLPNIFDDDPELTPCELSDFGTCMHQIWYYEPRLAAEFIAENKFLSSLSATEKAVEEPYLTWKYCGIGSRKWMLQNRQWIDFERFDYYYRTLKCTEGLNLDQESAQKLFVPSFQSALDLVGNQMATMEMAYIELVALIAILLLDPTNREFEVTTRELCATLRNQVLKDLFVLYSNGRVSEDPEVRLGTLIHIMSSTKIHAMRSMENMMMIKMFDICPRDRLFDEIVGIE